MDNSQQLLEQTLMVRSVESFLSYLSKLDEDNISENDFFKIQTKLERLPTLTDFKLNLLSIADVTDLDIWDDFEEKSSNAVSMAKRFLAKNNSLSLNDLDQLSIKSGNSSFVNNSHLPKLKLPTFNSDISEWPRFRDLYISMIHKNDSIDNIHKFYYLKSSLTSMALHVIDSIVITADSYLEAWELVFKRFENKRIATNHHIKTLVNLSAVPGNSAVRLRALVDNMKSHMCSLSTLGEPVDRSNVLFVYLMTQKLDSDLRDDWDKECFGSDNIPTTEQFLNFITQRAELLELNNSRTNSRSTIRHKESRTFSAIETPSCDFCQNTNHKPFHCSVYLNMTIDQRWAEIKHKKLCHNCLSSSHWIKECKKGTCKMCHKKHHTTLHPSANISVDQVATEPVVALSNNGRSFNAMLSTALVNVTDLHGNEHTARVLLDSGSQSNFITARFFKKLGLRASTVHYSIKGINKRATAVHDAVNLKLKSKISRFNSNINCLVIPSITEPLPNAFIDANNLNIPNNLQLADPTFNIPNDIDILLGAELFWTILGTRKIRLGNRNLALHQSQLGWIVTGHCVSNTERNTTCLHTSTRLLQSQLQTFWEIEESPLVRALSLEEEACEKHFLQHVSQDNTGRFTVRIPLKESPDRLGDSKAYALKRFYALEKRLAKTQV